MNNPEFLKNGDKVAIVAPARKISRDEIDAAVCWLQKTGFTPVFDDCLFDSDNQFAGNDNHRARLINSYLRDDDIKALWCARGGYGSVRIIDDFDVAAFLEKPKWIVGYSDVTVFHGKIQSLGFQSIHGTMPINVKNCDIKSLNSLYDALTGKKLSYTIPSSTMNISGKAEGELIGGNLSVLYSMLASDSFPNTNGKILFIEDLDEYLYHIDRMMMALQRAGALDNLVGLVVGGLTDMHDNAVPFGKTAEEIVLEHVQHRGYPVCFGFPAGHQDLNCALRLGSNVTLSVASSVTLQFQ